MPFLDKIIAKAHASTDVVGTINVPTGIPSQAYEAGPLFSSITILLMVVAGLFTLWQFLSGGFLFISSNGDKGKVAEAQQKIQMSITGLITMTASFIIIAIISRILFGRFDYILIPKLETIN